MVFNLKGLMQSVRPTQIGIGALETIQDRFKEDRELDQQRLSNTIDSAGLILEDSNEQVSLINKRNELFAQTAQMYGPSVANYLSQNKTFALYDDVKNVSALKDLDGKAREAQRGIAEGGFELSENPYQSDTRNALLDNLDKVEAELKSLNNIPDKTGKVAIRRKELENIKSKLTDEIIPAEGVKVKPFGTDVSPGRREQELAAYVATAINLGVDYTNKKEMEAIGFPALTLQEADAVLSIGKELNTLAGFFGEKVIAEVLLAGSKAEADAIKKGYQEQYEDVIRKQLPGLDKKENIIKLD